MRFALALLASLFVLSTISPPSDAARIRWRAPTTEEAIAIKQVLVDAGYVSWRIVKLENNRWDVEDAIAADGKKHDLRLEQMTYKIIETVAQ